MTLIVFGGSGFVGKQIVARASSLGLDPISISRKTGGNILLPDTYPKITVKTNIVTTVSILLESKSETYLESNYQSALTAANHLSKQAAILNFKPCFVYLSAANSPPFPFPQGYMTYKRKAEEELMKVPNIRCVILRPGMIYSYQERVAVLPIAFATMVVSGFARATGLDKLVPSFLRFAIDQPLNVDQVANAVVAAIKDDQACGIYQGKELEKLALGK